MKSFDRVQIACYYYTNFIGIVKYIMKITAKTRYALIFMLNLTERFESEQMTSLHDIVGKEKIPPKFMEQIVAALKSKDLIQAQRGARGGYRLARPPEQIDLKTICEAVQGPLCAKLERYPQAESLAQKAVADFLSQMWSNMDDFWSSQTLTGLVKASQEKNRTAMFYI